MFNYSLVCIYMDFHFIALLMLIIGCETAAQYFLQQKIKLNNNLFLLVGIILYSLVGLIYYTILNSGKKLAVANSLWNAGTELSVAILGFLFFNQSLSKRQIIGLILTIIGINLLG